MKTEEIQEKKKIKKSSKACGFVRKFTTVVAAVLVFVTGAIALAGCDKEEEKPPVDEPIPYTQIKDDIKDVMAEQNYTVNYRVDDSQKNLCLTKQNI